MGSVIARVILHGARAAGYAHGRVDRTLAALRRYRTRVQPENDRELSGNVTPWFSIPYWFAGFYTGYGAFIIGNWRHVNGWVKAFVAIGAAYVVWVVARIITRRTP